MRRYGVFSITGYGIQPDGSRAPSIARGFGNGLRYHDPVTTWYVTDDDLCGEVVLSTPYEHVARKKALRLNSEERRWEKEQQAATNGRAT
jgi:hypothetical protein